MGKNIFSKEAVLILAACFCFMSCHTMIIPILAGFTGSLGGSGLLMGTVVGITNLVSIRFRIVSGPMVDNSKRGLANNTYLIGLDCGMALGPMTGGMLYSHAQVQYFYPWLMITAVLGIAVYLIGRKRLSRL